MKIKIVLLSILSLALFALPQVTRADSSTSMRNSIFSQMENAGLRNYDITIDARYGRVTLEGTVASTRDRETIQTITARTEGVESITNNLKISPMAVAENTNLVDAISSELRASPDLKNFNFDVREQNGQVILGGQAATRHEAQTAETIARRTAGDTTVQNRIQVLPELTDSELASRVMSALGREQGLNARELKIMANNGTIVLQGSQPGFRDIDRILSVALMVDGVKDVKSAMTINGKPYATGIRRSK